MRVDRFGFSLALVALVAATGCSRDAEAEGATGRFTKGGDDRTGPYKVVEGWWKSAPNHGEAWSWGQISGVAADTPDRIIVTTWGDLNAEGEEVARRSNFVVVVDRDGNVVEQWSQWDTLFDHPHQAYIDPYDPERHVWVVDLGTTGSYEQVFKFTNDGKQLVLHLKDPQKGKTEQEQRLNKSPGPLDFGKPSVLAFLPDGHFLLGDGYQNGRIAKFTATGDFVSEFGSVGSGPGQFDLIHGLAVDRSGRIYVADRRNHRIQLFTSDGAYIEEWPDILDPVGVFVDESGSVWVLDGSLNRILKYSREGELLDYWGAYGQAFSLGRGRWSGGMALPHQMDMDSDGNLYVAEWSGRWLDKFVPRSAAKAERLIGRRMLLEN